MDAQAHITAFWSTVAPGYEAHGGNVAGHGTEAYRRWVEALAAVLPEPPAEVLDVATGTGYLALAAAGLGHHVTAIDLSAAMLDELRAHAVESDLRVDALVGDAVAPELAPGRFDVVASRHLLWTLREPEAAMASWWALLRPGGLLVAVDGFWFADPEDEAPPLFAEHYTAATKDELPFMHLDRPGPILDAMRAVGFVDVAAEPRPDLDSESGVPFLYTARRTSGR